MIVVDTSALAAVLSGEPDGERIHEALAGSTASLMSAANDLECSLVLSACFGDDGVHDLRLYLHEAGIEVVPVDRDQADLALDDCAPDAPHGGPAAGVLGRRLTNVPAHAPARGRDYGDET